MFKPDTSFLVLYTTDISRTHNFFKQLGVEIKQLENDKVVFQIGSFDLHFILNTTEPFAEYHYIAVAENYGQGIIFYIETSDISQAKEAIEKAGGTLKSSIFENHWGCLELLFEDSNGYKFALYQEISE